MSRLRLPAVSSSLLAFLVGTALALGLLPSCAPGFPDDVQAFYEEMQDNSWNFPRMNGAWEQQFGDAPYYGPAFFVRAEQRPGMPSYRELADAAVLHNVETLRRAQADRGFFLQNLEEVMMSTFGLLEYAAATGQPVGLAEVEDTIETINALVIGLRHYVDVEAGMFAIATYGPTAITAAVALLNVQYVTLLGAAADKDLATSRLELAQRIIAEIDTRAWDGQRYLIKPGDSQLELYPNTMMMLVLCRLYERTGDAAYLARAEAAFAAIAPLRSERGGYKSPYSAAAMGAKTDDYTTLSSQNYLTLALAVLFETTGKRIYYDEALFVLQFVRSHLYDAASGRILHHFIDGRIALPSDPEFFCTGCNLQLLYVVYYLQSVRR